VNLLLKLASVFFKIGLLTVGGGLAMIPIVQQEMVGRGWLTNRQFLDILGIAQMTPGPMSVNMATFVGYRVVGTEYPGAVWLAVAGSVVATLAVCAPSLLCINLLGAFWMRNREHPCLVSVFTFLRPLVTGLVIHAALLLGVNCLWADPVREWLSQSPDVRAGVLLVVAFLLTVLTRVSPVLVLLGGAIVGLLIF
jgi:chromate transporter